MPTKNALLLATTLLICPSIITAQDKQQTTVSANGEIVLSPHMMEIAQRRNDSLKHPDFIKLKIVPENSQQDYDEKRIEVYRAGSALNFKLLMTNTQAESFGVYAADVYQQMRPRLTRDGQLLAYQVTHQVKASSMVSESDRLLTRVQGRYIRLEPDETRSLGLIDLNKWYSPLKPGIYELVIKSRFHREGQWIESAPLTFKIVPQ